MILELAAAAALSHPTPAPAPAIRLEPCSVQEIPARCGTLLVPEDRSRLNGRNIALRVVVVPSVRKPARPDAFTYLTGGPGGAATDSTAWVVSTFSAVHETRDIVLVDQRGTGLSNSLLCLAPETSLNTAARARSYVRSCLRSAPGDVRRYGTRAAMDDLDAVRAALGYPQFDVYGVSYGATAAQIYLKEYPASVRTLVLDGATATDVSFWGRIAVNSENALDALAARCSANAACRHAFPGWRATLTKLIRAWNLHPVRNRPNERTTGAGLAGVIQSMLTDAHAAASIPLVVSRAANGDYGPLNEHIVGGGPNPQLMYWSIWCNEPWVGLDAKGPWHTDFDTWVTAALAYYHAACTNIPKRPEPASAWTFPRSGVPLLVLAGGADPQDPLGNLPDLKDAFPNSRAVVVPAMGHWVGRYGCVGEVVSRFVVAGNANAVDTSCVARVRPPRFALR